MLSGFYECSQSRKKKSTSNSESLSIPFTKCLWVPSAVLCTGKSCILNAGFSQGCLQLTEVTMYISNPLSKVMSYHSPKEPLHMGRLLLALPASECPSLPTDPAKYHKIKFWMTADVNLIINIVVFIQSHFT